MNTKRPTWLSPTATWPNVVKGLASLQGLTMSRLAALAGVSPPQLSNWMSGRVSLRPVAEARVVDALDLPPSLVAELGCSVGRPPEAPARLLTWAPPTTPGVPTADGPPDPCRLICDGLSFVLRSSDLDAALDTVESVFSGTEAEPLRPKDHWPYYQRRLRHGGLVVEWSPGRPKAALIRVDLRPTAKPADLRLAQRLVAGLGTDNWWLTRVDVAVDYALTPDAIELLGVRTALGRVDAATSAQRAVWSVPYLTPSEQPASALRASRVGSPRASTVRLYSHPARGPAPWRCARVEAQRRLKSKREQRRLQDLASLPDPFQAVRVVVMDLPGLLWEERLIVDKMRQLGATYVKRRMGPRFRAFADRLPDLATVELPCPSTLFAERWPSVAQAWLSALGLAIDTAPASLGEVDP